MHLFMQKICAMRAFPRGRLSRAAFFAAAEVSLILAFLNVIDNPDQDIPLLSVLMSPIYGFTAEDMAQLRRECGGETLYVSLLRAPKTSAVCVCAMS